MTNTSFYIHKRFIYIVKINDIVYDRYRKRNNHTANKGEQ